jgi:hypothetical protein
MAAFASDPSAILGTDEICRAVYAIERVEKRHRVAVLRALKRLAETGMPGLARRVLEFEKKSDWWFDATAHDWALPSTSGPAHGPRPRRTR